VFHREINSPLDQFELRDLVSIDAPIFFNTHISFTNIGLYLTCACIVALFINIFAFNNKIIFSN
jgi:F-type H+-transporting ATPase subunit a